jgi:two-component system, OmpR family, heavy metal sensor histidine kinase CusS
MTRARSIRLRLTLWYSIALSAGLILFAAAIWLSMRHSLLAENDRTLSDRAHKLSVFLNRELAANPAADNLREELDDYSRVLPAGMLLEIRDSSRSVYFTSSADFSFPAAGGAGAVFTTLRWKGDDYRLLSESFLLDGELFQIGIASSLDAIEAVLDRLRWLLIACIPAVILAAAVSGSWLSRRALKPVDEITAAAQSIGIENLSERLIVPQTGDELQRLSETWNGMLSRLEAAVKRLSQFTADASHELRTPLAIIRSTAEVAFRRPRSAEAYKEALGKVVAESERMTQLVEDLLFLARCDSSSVEIPMGAVDLIPIIEEICAEITPRVELKAMRLAFQAPSGSFCITGNYVALRRLLLVLLDNAIKYSGPGGEIRIDLAESGDGMSLEIRDTGIGIPEQALPRIFERFYRAEQARVEGEGGHGLGLSLAEGIAQRHHARIDVTSVPGRGSTFRVVFPTTQESVWRPAVAASIKVGN